MIGMLACRSDPAPRSSDNTIPNVTGAPKFDLVITGGTIIDGTGSDRFHGDVGIRNGRIVEISDGDDLSISALEVIDASGLIVSPSFG